MTKKFKLVEPNVEDQAPLLQTSDQFLAGFKPPDYLVEGLIQKRFIYSMTAPTGTGKTAIAKRIGTHVATGTPLAGREIEAGKVVFCAGENPTDVRMRWMLEMARLTPEQAALARANMIWREGYFKLSKPALRAQLDAELSAMGGAALIIFDTAAAFFEGDDDNNNIQMGDYARLLRTYVNVPGSPAALVTAHPIKNAAPDNLVPRGGGAFLNEVDGNFACVKRPDSNIVEVTTHGKFRGVEFAPVAFRLDVGTAPGLHDSKGRTIFTVCATPVTAADVAEDEAANAIRQQKVLDTLKANPGASLAELAKALGWFFRNGDPNKTLVNRAIQALKEDGQVKKKGGKWVPT